MNYVRNPDGSLTPATELRAAWWVRLEKALRRWWRADS